MRGSEGGAPSTSGPSAGPSGPSIRVEGWGPSGSGATPVAVPSTSPRDGARDGAAGLSVPTSLGLGASVGSVGSVAGLRVGGRGSPALERAGSCCSDSPSQGPSRPSKTLSMDVSPRPRLRRAQTLRPPPSPPAPDQEYIQLNHYKLMAEIGQGSYGIVKLAYNEKDQTHYAMKILDKAKLVKKFAFFRRPPPRRASGEGGAVRRAPDPLAQVNREIAILKKLSHPNVVKLIEVLDDRHDNYLYMVFEYLERGSVLEVPTDEPLPESLAWRYFRDTLQGLQYLHFQKIVHRDIKPSNLLLTQDGRVRIADFGVSAEFQGLDAFLTGTAGTPAFMAPEALVQDPAHFYSGRAQDVWSLGVTLFCFLYGKVPFHDNFVIALHRKIKMDPLVFPSQPSTSEQAKDLIEHMLTKDPGFRHSLAEIGAHAWVTKGGKEPLEGEEEMQLIQVTQAEIETSVRVVPSLDTLILIKAMGQRRRFGNPFRSGSGGGGGAEEEGRGGAVREAVGSAVEAVREGVRGPAVGMSSQLAQLSLASAARSKEAHLLDLANNTVHSITKKLSPRRANTLK